MKVKPKKVKINNKKPAVDLVKISKLAKKNKLTRKQENLVVEIVTNPARKGKELVKAAGYSQSITNDNPGQVLRRERVVNTVQEYFQSTGITDRVNSFYDKILDLPESDRENIKLKQEAIKEIHKVRGDYAPRKTDIRRANINIDTVIEEDDTE